MSSNKVLFLFTTTFPCNNKLAQYLADEYPYWSESYDKIYVFPSKIGPIERGVSENSEVVDLYNYAKINKVRFIWNLPTLFVVYLSELIKTKRKRFYLKNIKALIVSLNNALELSRGLKEFIIEKELDRSNITAYSYWFYHWALTLSLSVDKNVLNKFISRGHQGDIYTDGIKRRKNDFRNQFLYTKLKNTSTLYLISDHANNYLSKLFPKFKTTFKTEYLGSFNHFEAKEVLPSSDGIVRFVSCSGIDHLVKRVFLIPEILTKVSENVEWVHFGGTKEAILELEKQVKKYKNITLICKGFVPKKEILEYYRDYYIDMFINISTVEGISVAMMEAISFGIPVIGTRVNGTPEIANEKTGICVNVDFDKMELSEQIKDFLNSPDIIGFRGGVRNYWKEKFDADTNYIRFKKLLEKQ